MGRLPGNNKDIVITLDDNNNAVYDTAQLAFDATGNGFARAIFQYKQYKDTVDFTCELSPLKTAVNKTINGSFKKSCNKTRDGHRSLKIQWL